MTSKEEQVIKSGHFVNQNSLENGFREIGIKLGMTLLVHSSLSSLGWVCGHAAAVILALKSVLGETGTLVMPAHSSDLSDPKDWSNPPVPESWKQPIRDTMPPFDPYLTPTRHMGAVSDSMLRMRDSIRSQHPHLSCVANGPLAAEITQSHPLDCALGLINSPLGKLYDLEASILLVGVGYSNCTALHLAEYISEFKSKKQAHYGAPIKVNGKREWVTWKDLLYNEDDFMEIGKAFEHQTSSVNTYSIGKATCRLIPLRELVDFSVEWMNKNR